MKARSALADYVSPGAPEVAREHLNGITYELFILDASILSIVNLALEVVVPNPSQSWLLMLYVDEKPGAQPAGQA